MPQIGPAKIATRFPGYLFSIAIILVYLWDGLLYHRHWASFCREAQSSHTSIGTTHLVMADLCALAFFCSISLIALYLISRWAAKVTADTDPKVARFVLLSGAILTAGVAVVILAGAWANIVRVHAYSLGEPGHRLPAYLPWERELAMASFFVLIVAAAAALGSSRLHYKNKAFWSLVYTALAVALSFSSSARLSYYGVAFCFFLGAAVLQEHISEGIPEANCEPKETASWHGKQVTVKALLVPRYLWTTASIIVAIDGERILQTGGQLKIVGSCSSPFTDADGQHIAELRWGIGWFPSFPYRLCIDGTELLSSRVRVYNWPLIALPLAAYVLLLALFHHVLHHR